MNEEHGSLAYGPRRTNLLQMSDSRRGRRLRGGLPAEDAVVVLVTEDQGLQDEVARLAAAAGIGISVAAGIPDALVLDPEVLLLGSDHLRFLAARGGGTRGPAGIPAAAFLPAGKTEVIVVGLTPDTGVWDAAAESSAARVAILPAAAGWLAGYLGRQRGVSGGAVLGVLGGCGGAGASAVACWLSAAAADRGESVLLVEGDPWGAGLDWMLGSAELGGVRWPDLAELRGSLNPVQMAAGLPALAGFSLLARGNGLAPPEAAAARAVMDAARSGYGLTVVDLGRASGPDTLLPFCDQVLLVVPGRSAGILAARTLLPYLGPAPTRAVVRGPLGDGLDDLRTAEALGLPLAGYVPYLNGAGRAVDAGQVLGCLGRRRLRRGIAQILGGVLSGPAGEAP